MSIKQQRAFIDEFGNSGFDFSKDNVSSHFIVTAIIVDEEAIPELEKSIEPIRKKYFQTGEMKSSGVGRNNLRGKKILDELVKLDFHIYAVVVDKSKLTSEGFNYHQSFYKFLHALTDQELYRAFPNIKLSADEHGRKEFMEGFIEYIKKRHVPTLFDRADFEFVKSTPALLLQLADFICGTIARCFDKTVITPEGKNFIRSLKDANRVISIVDWPEQYTPYVYQTDLLRSSTFDQLIATQSLTLAYEFLRSSSKKAFTRYQVRCIKFLLFNYHYVDPEEYVPAWKIIRHLNLGRSPQINAYHFKSKVIAKLRDAGVIISTSPKGYKIPANERDLYNYINQVSSNIRPMLERVKGCRNQFRLATKNALDVLDKPEYEYLKKFFD
ncbi:MAG: DUF3800 domain-containing protein [Blastocatellia bacterium]